MQKISVIVPVYNVEKYLDKCISTIINQTYKDLEIILIDDGSTDNSGRLCDYYKTVDDRIIVIHKNNEGQAIARNMGLDISSGSYISFVDSDDYLECDMYEKLMNYALNYNSDLIIFGSFFNNGIRTTKSNTPLSIITIEGRKKIVYKYFIDEDISNVVWDKFYKKDIFNDLRFPNLRSREDAFLMPHILNNSERTLIVPEHFYTQFIRIGSTEHKKFNTNDLSSLDVSTSISSFIHTFYPELNKLAYKHSTYSYVITMRRIVLSFSYKKFNDIYMNMLMKLNSEIHLLKNNAFISKKYLEECNFIAKHNFIWRNKLYIVSLINNTKIFLKRIYLKVNKNGNY